MSEHPIEALMKTAMQSIREMVDVNTIVGDAVQTPDGTVIIPISRVTFGFAAGGGEYGYGAGEETDRDSQDENEDSGGGKFPFAGGSGAGVSINPVAFMVVGNGHIKLLPVNINSTIDKILDLVPEFLCRLENICKKKIAVRKEKEEDTE
ncbi:MAG TPA: GerW family sporulation protein [Clostridiales bacterium]|nr:GerW family sporulation protein [Clostridiales bacterium]HPV01948.1 GerW family sporulation protein [Clostridiales bacterium]